MAEEVENDDQWLYGDNPDAPAVDGVADESKTEDQLLETPEDTDEPAKPEDEDEDKLLEEKADENNDESVEKVENNETEKAASEGSDKEDYDEDSDDDVNVVIGDIKTTPAYTSLNIKRGGLLTSTAKGDKTQSTQPGKFSVEEFDQAGSINGVPVTDFNLDILEDKPWRKPGADITDYFNFGFNEETWKAYCERQKRMRVSESGTGLLPLNSIGMPRGPVPIMNDNSKYSGTFSGVRKAGPPPGRRMTGSIDVIGGATTRINTPVSKTEPPKENVIQVMTADRREYSRKPGFPDMSMPPPPTNSFEDFHPEYGFNPEPEPFYGGYEPTQDSQWGVEPLPGWQPQGIRYLTPTLTPPMMPAPVPNMVPPPLQSLPKPVPGPAVSPTDNGQEVQSRPRSRERESSRREIAEKTRERSSRDRERSHRRERSRSRSRRHKSRSRSPSHRSHRKKKSRRQHEDDD